MEFLKHYILLIIFVLAVVSITVYGMFYLMNKAVDFNTDYERIKLRIYNKENREEVCDESRIVCYQEEGYIYHWLFWDYKDFDEANLIR